MKFPAAAATLRKYAEAAKAGHRERLACGQIVEMARLVSDPGFLVEARKALEELGCTADAAEVGEWAASGRSPTAPEDRRRLYVVCLKAAIGSNTKLKTKGALT
jgi:hypothetical protein